MTWTETVWVTLAKDWGPYPAGTTVEVDTIKAGTLDELGYLEHPDEPRPRRRRGQE